MTNTNRLALIQRAAKQGAIITTATALILGLSAVAASGNAGDVGAKPTRQQILTALRLMSDSYREYLCNAYIIKKESNYNINAKNGSHYGLPQGRTQYLRTATYTQQLHWYMKYIQARYSGDGCKAKAHHLKHNWY